MAPGVIGARNLPPVLHRGFVSVQSSMLVPKRDHSEGHVEAQEVGNDVLSQSIVMVTWL